MANADQPEGSRSDLNVEMPHEKQLELFANEMDKLINLYTCDEYDLTYADVVWCLNIKIHTIIRACVEVVIDEGKEAEDGEGA